MPDDLKGAVERLSTWLAASGLKTLRFYHAQTSDETGEYYTKRAQLMSGDALFCDLLDPDAGDWSDEDFEHIALAINTLPKLLAHLSRIQEENERKDAALVLSLIHI